MTNLPECRHGGIFRPRVERLFVRGSDKTGLVEGVLKQVALVEDVVGDVPVHGVLCFIDSEWPMFASPFTVRGVQVLWPKRLVTQLQRVVEPVLDVGAVTEVLARRFVRA